MENTAVVVLRVPQEVVEAYEDDDGVGEDPLADVDPLLVIECASDDQAIGLLDAITEYMKPYAKLSDKLFKKRLIRRFAN